MRVLQGGPIGSATRGQRAHRPGHAHAEVAGVLVLALTSVPREWAAILREEAANHTCARVGVETLKSRGRRRCVLEVEDAHCEERRRHSALEPVSNEIPAAQRLLCKLAEALI